MQDRLALTPTCIFAWPLCLPQLSRKKPPDINCTDLLGNTPLHSAAYRGQKQCAQKLLRSGARPDIKNKNGREHLPLGFCWVRTGVFHRVFFFSCFHFKHREWRFCSHISTMGSATFFFACVILRQFVTITTGSPFHCQQYIALIWTK